MVGAEPFGTAAIAAGYPAINSPYITMSQKSMLTSAYFTFEDQLAKNPELFKNIRAAINESLEYAQKNPDGVRKQLPKFTKLGPDVGANTNWSWPPARTRSCRLSRAPDWPTSPPCAPGRTPILSWPPARIAERWWSSAGGCSDWKPPSRAASCRRSRAARPDSPRAMLLNDIAIGLFVLDVFLVMIGWPATSTDESFAETPRQTFHNR